MKIIPVSFIPMELLDVLWTAAQAELLCAEEEAFRILAGGTLVKTSCYKKCNRSAREKGERRL